MNHIKIEIKENNNIINFPASSMLESMWSSMSSSMQLAEECLREEEGGSTQESNPVEGIEMFAHAIDSSK